MLKLRIVCVGRVKSKPVQDLIKDYSSRISHYFPIEVITVKDGASTLKSMKAGDLFVVCDEKGDQKTSAELAVFIKTNQKNNINRIIFYIGGHEGVEHVVKKQAHKMLSLSKMTFPHEFAQAILLEQIYRACTIINGESYHK